MPGRDMMARMRCAALLVPIFAAWSAAAVPTEREVADWAIRVGGRVAIEGRKRPVIDAAELPGALRIDFSHFERLESLDVSYTTFNDAGMKSLRGLKGLRRLYLRDTLVTDEGLESLADLTSLEEIDLYGTTTLGLKGGVGMPWRFITYQATCPPAETTAPSLPNCRVDLVGATVSAAAGADVQHPRRPGDQAVAEWIRKLGGKAELADGKLVAIRLRSVRVSDAQVADLRALSTLRVLDLSATEISDLGLESLGDGTDVGDATLKTLGTLHSLEELALDAARFSDKQFAALGTLDRLKSPRVSHTRLGAAGIQVLGSMGNLRALNLNYTAIDDHALESLKSLTQLEELHLDNTAITDAGLDSLGGLRHLKLLNVYHTAVTQKAFDRFHIALPACKVIWDRDSALPNRRRG
jgi:internalin A